ncbi:MAG: hypothetical protein H7Y06_10420 [Opitutaceae bacterium]|nr:hypothetical protein [Opitutaceae bacterium]
MKTILPGFLISLVTICMLAGCSSWSAGNAQNEITVSARYVRISGALPEAKGSLAFLADEAALRAGTLTLTRAQADAALAQLAKIAQQEVRSTSTGTVPEGYAMRIKLTGPEKQKFPEATGSSVSIKGMAFAPRDDVSVELGFFPDVSAGRVIRMDVEMMVTACDGFIEYGDKLVTIAPGGEDGNPPPTTVKLPKGFYQPIFSTQSVRAEVRMTAGAVVVLRADREKRDAPEGLMDRAGQAMANVPPETMLVFLTAELGPGKR